MFTLKGKNNAKNKKFSNVRGANRIIVLLWQFYKIVSRELLYNGYGWGEFENYVTNEKLTLLLSLF